MRCLRRLQYVVVTYRTTTDIRMLCPNLRVDRLVSLMHIALVCFQLVRLEFWTSRDLPPVNHIQEWLKRVPTYPLQYSNPRRDLVGASV